MNDVLSYDEACAERRPGYAEAKAAGHTRFQGSPCRRGHSGLRLVSGRQCVECHRQNHARYYSTAAGRRKQIEYVKKSQKKHAAKYRQYQREWRRKQAAEKCAEQIKAGICPRKHCPMRAARTNVEELGLTEIIRQSTLSSGLLFEALIADGFTARELFAAMHSIAND